MYLGVTMTSNTWLERAIDQESASLNLREATLDDVPFCAQAIVEVSANSLDEPLKLLRESLGFNTLEELLEAVLYEESSDLISLKHMVLVEADGAPQGLVFAYDPSLGKSMLPDFIKGLLSVRDLNLLKALSGASVTSVQGSLLYLNTLYVSPAMRGQHLGKLLVKLALHKASLLGLNGIFLHCFADNTKALDFYKALGFKTIEDFAYPQELYEVHSQGGVFLKLELNKADPLKLSPASKQEAANVF